MSTLFRAVVLSLLVIGSVSAVSPSTMQTEQGGLNTATSLDPGSVELNSGQTTTVDIVVEDAQHGVSAFNFGVRVANESVANITDVTVAPSLDPAVKNDPNPAGSGLISVRAAGADSADTGRVTVATVTVESKREGTTDLQLLAQTVGNERNRSYTITASNDATITVGGEDDGTPAPEPGAPTIDATVEGEQLPDGNYEAPATVTLSASDPGGQVNFIEYRVDNGSFTQVSSSSAIVKLTADGNHTVTYRAVDDDGTESETKQLDVRIGSEASPVRSFTASNPGTVVEARVLTTEPLIGLEISVASDGQTVQTLTRSEIASDSLDNGSFLYDATFVRVDEGTTYTVTLERAETGAGDWARGQSRTVTVAPDEVQLELTVDDRTVSPGRTLGFEVTRARDGFSVHDATISVDGVTLDTGTDNYAEYTFAESGTYTATVRKDRGPETVYRSDSVEIEVRGGSEDTITGDANGDGEVNIFDAVLVGRAWQTERGDEGYSDAADLNNDGEVNIFDAVVVGRNWQATAE